MHSLHRHASPIPLIRSMGQAVSHQKREGYPSEISFMVSPWPELHELVSKIAFHLEFEVDCPDVGPNQL